MRQARVASNYPRLSFVKGHERLLKGAKGFSLSTFPLPLVTPNRPYYPYSIPPPPPHFIINDNFSIYLR